MVFGIRQRGHTAGRQFHKGCGGQADRKGHQPQGRTGGLVAKLR